MDGLAAALPGAPGSNRWCRAHSRICLRWAALPSQPVCRHQAHPTT